MHPITTNYDKTIDDFEAVFADILSASEKKSPIPGVNIMTPLWLGTWKYGKKWAELATGNMPDVDGNRIRVFSITFRSVAKPDEMDDGMLIDPNKVKTMEDVRAEYDAAVEKLR